MDQHQQARNVTSPGAARRSVAFRWLQQRRSPAAMFVLRRQKRAPRW